MPLPATARRSLRRWCRRSGARRPRWPAGGPARARFGRLPHQRGVVRRDGAVAQLQVVLEAHAHVAAEGRRGRDAGVFFRSEGADGPGQRMVAGGQEGQQVLGGRGLSRAVAAQHEQHRPGAGRHQSALAQRLPAARVGLVVQDDLGQHAALGQPCQEGRQFAFRDLGHGDLAQADGDGLGRQFAHHRHLLGGAVDAGGLAGHLHQQLVAHRLAHGGQRVAIGLGVQQVASVRAARACASWPRRRPGRRAPRGPAPRPSAARRDGRRPACRRRWAPR